MKRMAAPMAMASAFSMDKEEEECDDDDSFGYGGLGEGGGRGPAPTPIANVDLTSAVESVEVSAEGKASASGADIFQYKVCGVERECRSSMGRELC